MARICEIKYRAFNRKGEERIALVQAELDYMMPFGALAALIRLRVNPSITAGDILEITDLQNNRTVYLKPV